MKKLITTGLFSVVAFSFFCGLTAKAVDAQQVGDNLWNIRVNLDNRFHSNESWLRPWRKDYDDGWGRWVAGYSYELRWNQGPCPIKQPHQYYR